MYNFIVCFFLVFKYATLLKNKKSAKSPLLPFTQLILKAISVSCIKDSILEPSQPHNSHRQRAMTP